MHQHNKPKDYTYYIDGGNNKIVMLVHGLTGAPVEMAKIGKLLKLEGFSSYAPLLAGHGGSVQDLIKTNWEDWYNGLVAELKLAYNKYGKVHIVGLCAGGALALLLSKQHSHMINSIAIYSPILSYNGWNMRFYYSWANYLLNITLKLFPWLNKKELKETFPYGIKNEKIRNLAIKAFNKNTGIMEVYPLRSLNEYLKLVRVVKKELKNFKVPLLIVQSIYDDISKHSGALYMQKHYGGICDLYLLNNSYHLINVDQQKELVAKQTASFFQKYS